MWPFPLFPSSQVETPSPSTRRPSHPAWTGWRCVWPSLSKTWTPSLPRSRAWSTWTSSRTDPAAASADESPCCSLSSGRSGYGEREGTLFQDTETSRFEFSTHISSVSNSDRRNLYFFLRVTMCLIWSPVVKTSSRRDHNVNKIFCFVLSCRKFIPCFFKGSSISLKVTIR